LRHQRIPPQRARSLRRRRVRYVSVLPFVACIAGPAPRGVVYRSHL